MLTGKKLLVLGGASQHCKVVEAAHELGLKVFVTDYLNNSPAKKMADVSLMYDVKDVDTIVDYCREEKIDGVINTSLDACQIPYQKICEKLSVPRYGNAEQFFQLTNKQAFKEMCSKYGVDTITTYTVEALKDAKITESSQIEFPVMIKPEDSRGSRGQSVCYGLEEALKAVEYAAKESSTGRVIIEKYMENAEDFAAAYIIVDGKAHLIRTCDRYTGQEEEGLNRIAIAAANPSKHTQMYLQNVNNKVISMLEGMGIENGPVFMQGIIDCDTVRFYDPGFRFSGGEYERLFKLATGIDLIKMLVTFAVTGKMDGSSLKADSILLGGKRILHLDPTLHPGKIAQIIGKEKIEQHEKVVSFFERYEEGETVPNRNDVSRRYAEICILSESKDEEKEIVKFIQKELHVLDEEGNDLICSPLSTEVL
ncbi:ATP-grasp domain-containing protein [Mediterraneibacter glycyrrhizinilyticus]|nr:ATP-grasp domain-containing protein [Mediterraneibacter glycyrrhizinilyticus]MBM6853244.1 ATP-grasp domain-containing protein [Mediterraneibacter glycyrrhizinilyticus]